MNYASDFPGITFAQDSIEIQVIQHYLYVKTDHTRPLLSLWPTIRRLKVQTSYNWCCMR